MIEHQFDTRTERAVASTQVWLKSKGLTARTIPIDFRSPISDELPLDPATMVLGLPTKRAKKHSKDELVSVTKGWPVGTFDGSKPENKPTLDALLDRRTSSIFLDMQRLPANAIAFYRPFHLEPFDRWGIYIFVEPLLSYAERVKLSLPFFPQVSKAVLMHLVLFEMFHHEFYHHLVESAATTIEIIADGLGGLVPRYLSYSKLRTENQFTWHEHQPLEEALANAYAYNSLSFISRVKAGYRDALERYPS